MKKLLTLIAFICFWANANAQYVNIPDSNFRKFLIAKYPSCFDTLGMMDTTCSGILNDTTLNCSFNEIVNLSGIYYFKKLKFLSCLGNKILTIDSLPNYLVVLICNRNKINSIVNLPNTVKNLDCSNNELTSLPNLPHGIEYLLCGDNLLTHIPKLPSSLNYFHCANNLITSIDTINFFIDEIECSFNKLTSLSFFQGGSNRLLCSNNLLTNIDSLPNNILALDCGNNFINSIKKLPDSLYSFYCGKNSLSLLSSLPKKLLYLNCEFNQLSSLPVLPTNLISLSLTNNSNLFCLPILPNTLNDINYSYTNVKCIPNIPSALSSNNFTICNPTNNPNNCNSFPVIQSFVYTDYNNNGKFDVNELPLKSIKVSLANNYGYTNPDGLAFLAADSLGTYTITAQAPPLYKAVPAGYTHTFNRYDTLVYDTFALQPLVTKDSLSIGITPVNFAARPGLKYVYNVGYENVGTTVVNTNLSFVIDTSKLVFDSASVGSFNGNILSHSVSNFVPGQNGNLLVYCRVKPTPVLGSSLQAMATINGGSAIANDSVVTTIRGSFDPNDKQATPALSVAQVASNSKWIDYTIRFENTGSDTAFTVVVADTLDASKLQTGTVQLTGMSHPVKATQNDNIIFFEFRNINLPDSNIDKVKCNGFVSFKVKPLTSLVNGMTVPNKAAIYFDYNEPVVTNTAQTVIGTLPLTLVNFSAIFKEEENKIFVYWNTANEINTSFFIIEQSTDGRGFAPAAEVAATGKGNNSYYYQLNANSQQTTVYLRLKMVDRNGTYTYSNIVKLMNNKGQLVIEVAPNPAKKILNIKASAALNNTTATIVNALGKTIKTFTLKQGYQIIDIAALPNGVYYLKCVNGVSKFVKE